MSYYLVCNLQFEELTSAIRGEDKAEVDRIIENGGNINVKVNSS